MILLALALAANCPNPEVLDATKSVGEKLAFGAVGSMVLPAHPMDPERARYVLELLPAGICPARIVMNEQWTKIDDRKISATLWPAKPREKLVYRNNKWVDETPPTPSRAEIEAAWTAAVSRAVAP